MCVQPLAPQKNPSAPRRRRELCCSRSYPNTKPSLSTGHRAPAGLGIISQGFWVFSCFVGRFWGCSATCCHHRLLLGTPLDLWATTENLGTCWGDTPGRNPCLCLHPILRIAAELLEKIKLSKKKPLREKGNIGSKGWSEMRPQGWAGPLGHEVAPTLSQHSRWTQHHLLSPFGQLDTVFCFLLCVCPLGALAIVIPNHHCSLLAQ